ncbi:MAG: nitroreductase family protein, partial [Tannerellaceae bacterium]
SCWVQVRERETAEATSSEQYVRDLLNIPYHMQVLSIVAVGHKGQERKPYDETNLQWEKVHIGSFKSIDTNLDNE